MEENLMIDQVKIGNFLKFLRKNKGKTQEEIADLTKSPNPKNSKNSTLMLKVKNKMFALRDGRWPKMRKLQFHK